MQLLAVSCILLRPKLATVVTVRAEGWTPWPVHTTRQCRRAKRKRGPRPDERTQHYHGRPISKGFVSNT